MKKKGRSLGGSLFAIKASIATMASFFVGVAIVYSLKGGAKASPVDGMYSCEIGMDCVFYIRNGKYVPYYKRGNNSSLSDFTITSDYVLQEKSTGTYYCNENEFTGKNGNVDKRYWGMRCGRSGWMPSRRSDGFP